MVVGEALARGWWSGGGGESGVKSDALLDKGALKRDTLGR